MATILTFHVWMTSPPVLLIREFFFFRTLSHFSMFVVPVKFIDEMCAEGCEGNSRKEDGMYHFFLKA